MQRCSMCFADRSVQNVLPGASPVCRGCFQYIDKTMGWLEHQGILVELVVKQTGQYLMPAQLREAPLPPIDSQDAERRDSSPVEALETPSVDQRVKMGRKTRSNGL